MKNYIKANFSIVFIAISLCISSSIAYALVSIFLQRILDAALSFQVDSFVREMIVALVFFVGILILVFFYNLFVAKSILSVLITIRQRMYTGISQKTIAEFQTKDTAEYISVFNNDLKILEENYFYAMFTLCENITLFVSSLIIMFYYSPIIAGITAISIILMIVVPTIVGVPIQKKQSQYSSQLGLFTEKLKDILLGFEVIKTYNIEAKEEAIFDDSNKRLMKSKYSVDRMFVFSEILSISLALVMQVGIIGLAAYFVMLGNITVGALLALTQLGSALAQPLISIFNHIPKVKSTKEIIKKINEISKSNEKDFTKNHIQFSNTIELRNVAFGYTNERLILDDVNLLIEKGKKYAILGENGSGKSTFIKLLSGYFTEYDGMIQVDTTTLSKDANSDLFQITSIIHQNVFLFNDTIKNNITLYGSYSDTEVIDVIQKSGLFEMFQSGKLSLDTIVRENGQNLSGGQRQRIAIARALIRQKPILILDEGTSAMEQKTSFEIEQLLFADTDVTLLIITHKLMEEHLKVYDELIVLADGKVAEKGHYGALMEQEGVLYHMMEKTISE